MHYCRVASRVKLSWKISLTLLVLELVMEVEVDQPEGVRLLLLAVTLVGKRLRRMVVGMVRDGFRRMCHWD